MDVKCDFCKAKHLPVTKYKCTGINLGGKVETTVRMCVCCSANTDEDWLAYQLDWDDVTEMKAEE